MRFENILEWYSGKARDTIVSFTIPALVECEVLGCWKKGVARTVRATLNKQNVAARWARDVEAALRIERDYAHPLHNALSNLRYGSYGRAPEMLAAASLEKIRSGPYLYTPTKGEGRGVAQDVGAALERWARAFAEVAELVALLDSRRPKPVVVMGTLSPTVAQNVSAHVGVDISTIQSPAMHGEWVERLIKGKKVTVYEVVIDWPDGTRHNKSRFLNSASNSLCQACGHAIQDPYNWVPILAYGPSGGAATAPYSLWVGRDCARKLFGCEVEGDAVYVGRGQP